MIGQHPNNNIIIYINLIWNQKILKLLKNHLSQEKKLLASEESSVKLIKHYWD